MPINRVSNSRHTGVDQNHSWLTTGPETNPRSREPSLYRSAEVELHIHTENTTPSIPIIYVPVSALLWQTNREFVIFPSDDLFRVPPRHLDASYTSLLSFIIDLCYTSCETLDLRLEIYESVL
jgi:hypothetical protein